MAYHDEKPKLNSPLNSAEIRGNFEFLKKVISKEHTWDDKEPLSSQHNLEEMKAVVPKSMETLHYTTGSHAGLKGNQIACTSVTRHDVPAEIEEGTQSFQKILQELVKRSHSHSVQTHKYIGNCNCNCDCNCGGNN